MQVIYSIFLPMTTGEFQHVLADSNRVTDRLSDGLTDESDDIWMERNFPGYWIFTKFHTAILLGIFTVNLADGWLDGTDNRHID